MPQAFLGDETTEIANVQRLATSCAGARTRLGYCRDDALCSGSGEICERHLAFLQSTAKVLPVCLSSKGHGVEAVVFQQTFPCSVSER